MGNPIQKIETSESSCPAPLLKDEISADFPTFWAIGNLGLLDTNLLGVFCSIRCPGNIILNTYDFMRILRDAGVAVVSGFHSPIETDCLDILLKSSQPIVACPARGIVRMRIPNTWKKPIDEGRLLILSPFGEKQKRPTVSTAQQRNHLVAKLGRSFLIPFAPSSRA
jgi:predicted Rossmann fold nucleotide-binding protein DprA/Smf involved in DNA uptake